MRVLACANGIETGAIKRSARFEGDLGDGVQILEHVDVAHARCLPVPVGQVQGAQRRATVEEVVERSGVAGEQRRIEVRTIERRECRVALEPAFHAGGADLERAIQDCIDLERRLLDGGDRALPWQCARSCGHTIARSGVDGFVELCCIDTHGEDLAVSIP